MKTRHCEVVVNGMVEVVADLWDCQYLQEQYIDCEGAKILPVGKKTFGGCRSRVYGLVNMKNRWWILTKPEVVK